MNKWMKLSMVGMALSASAVGASQSVQQQPVPDDSRISRDVMVDAMDFAGGSKLKDRMSVPTEYENLEIVLVTSIG